MDKTFELTEMRDILMGLAVVAAEVLDGEERPEDPGVCVVSLEVSFERGVFVALDFSSIIAPL